MAKNLYEPWMMEAYLMFQERKFETRYIAFRLGKDEGETTRAICAIHQHKIKHSKYLQVSDLFDVIKPEKVSPENVRILP